MKRLFVLVATAVLLAGSALAQAPQAVTVPDSGEKKARALLDKMIQALGGDAYLNYTTRTDKGRTYTFYRGDPNSPSVQFVHNWQWPDKDSFQVAVAADMMLQDPVFGVPIDITKKSNIVTYIHNGDKGYEITYRGTAAEEAKELREFLRRRAHSLEIVLRQWLKEPGTLVMYSGTAIADRRLVEEVTIINSQNDSVTIAIDPDTYLPLRRIFTYRDEQNYKTDDVLVYANYRKVEGIMAPMSVVRMRNDEMVGQQFLTEVHYNVAFEPAQFEATVTYDPMAPPKKK